MNKKICIGKIVAAHGIRGEVKVRSYTANPLNIDHYGDVEDATGLHHFKLKSKGMASTNVRVKIEGIDDRNAAEALIGTELYVDRDTFPELAEDEYYQADLVGLNVCLHTPDNAIGKVVGMYNFGAGDIIEIRLNQQKQTEMLPFTQAYVPTVNVAEGYIIVSSASMVFADEKE